MRYFVTGATGFIGGELTRQLRAAGHDTVALIRDPGRASALAELGVELVQGDIADRASLKGSMAGVDGVFHVAGWSRVGVRAARELAGRINVEGTRHVLEAMREARVSKGVYTSTLGVFSDTGGHLRDETYRHEGPRMSVYEDTKWRAHYEVAMPMMEAGLPLVIVMPGNVYGRGDTSQMGAFMRQYATARAIVVPGGTAYSSAHVEDVARAHILAMERGIPGQTYIIGGPCHALTDVLDVIAAAAGRRPITITSPPALSRGLSRVVGLVERFLPVPERYAAETLRVTAGTTYLGDNAKARRDLGYMPRPMEEGVRRTIEEYLREREPVDGDS